MAANEMNGPPDGERDVPAERPLEVEEPRRLASARFVVEEVDSKAAHLRAAMDPANQSLGEALRLSYRVLQIAIVALVVTFLFSGFQSVRDGATGATTQEAVDEMLALMRHSANGGHD